MKTRLFADGIDGAQRRWAREHSQALVEKMRLLLLIWTVIATPSACVFVLSQQICWGMDDDTARSQALNMIESCHIFYAQQGRYPNALHELAAPPRGKPVMDWVPADPWGNEYRFLLRGGEFNDITVMSLGEDGLHSDDDIVVDREQLGSPVEELVNDCSQ